MKKLDPVQDGKSAAVLPKERAVNLARALDDFAKHTIANIPALRITENHNRFRAEIEALKKKIL